MFFGNRAFISALHSSRFSLVSPLPMPSGADTLSARSTGRGARCKVCIAPKCFAPPCERVNPPNHPAALQGVWWFFCILFFYYVCLCLPSLLRARWFPFELVANLLMGQVLLTDSSRLSRFVSKRAKELPAQAL